MKATSAVVVVALGGCAIMEMKPLAANYDERTIPRCETESVYAVGDTLMALLAGAAVAVVLTSDQPVDDDIRLRDTLLFGTYGSLSALSAALGFKWVAECDRAKKQWDQRQIEQDTLVQKMRSRHANERKRDRQERRASEREIAAVRARKLAKARTPRGHFCAVSAATPNVGLCARLRAECEKAQGAALAVVPDLGSCSLVETAWCFGNAELETCQPTEAACVDQQARAAATAAPSAIAECAERE